MQIFAQLLVLFLGILMFFVKREHKLGVLLLTSICLRCVTVKFIPLGGAVYFLPFCFILSECQHWKNHVAFIKKTIFYPLMIMMVVAVIILKINSPHYSGIGVSTRLIITELIPKYFVIIYAFLCIKSVDSLRIASKYCFYGMVVLTAFGVMNLMTKNAMWVDQMYQGIEVIDVFNDLGSRFTHADRFRVQAMFLNPFDYGYICIMMSLFFFYLYQKKIVAKKRFIVVGIFSLFGVFFCGSRLVIMCMIIGIAIYILCAYKPSEKIKYMLLALLLFIVCYNTIPVVEEKINQMTTMFNTNSNISGSSSIHMRIVQFMRILYYIRDNVMFGNGKDYFLIDMGWEGGYKKLIDSDLYGAESVMILYLLERGIIGVMFWWIFYLAILRYSYNIRGNDKKTLALSMSVLIVFICFANLTGELASVYPTLLILGIALKLQMVNKTQHLIMNKNKFS